MPAAAEAIDDAIERARPTLRGRDGAKVLDNMKPALEKVAEAKATGVPVQLAVARSVTDVQQKVQLNPQSRQAVLDAAYRVYTASPATLATRSSPKPSPKPSPSPEPSPELTEPAANATLPEDMLPAANTTDAANATMPEDMGSSDNSTAPLEALEPTGSEADNTTATAVAPKAEPAAAAAAASPAPSPAPATPSPAPRKSGAAAGLVSSSLLAFMAAAVVVLL